MTSQQKVAAINSAPKIIIKRFKKSAFRTTNALQVTNNGAEITRLTIEVCIERDGHLMTDKRPHYVTMKHVRSGDTKTVSLPHLFGQNRKYVITGYKGRITNGGVLLSPFNGYYGDFGPTSPLSDAVAFLKDVYSSIRNYRRIEAINNRNRSTLLHAMHFKTQQRKVL